MKISLSQNHFFVWSGSSVQHTKKQKIYKMLKNEGKRILCLLYLHISSINFYYQGNKRKHLKIIHKSFFIK